MDREAEELSHSMFRKDDLVSRLGYHRDRIATLWAEEAAQLAGSHYEESPFENLRDVGAHLVDVTAESAQTGSDTPLEEYLGQVSQSRLTQGFDIGEVIEGLLLWREIVVREAFPGRSSDDDGLIVELDTWVRHMVGRFGHLFAEAIQYRLKEQEARTSDEIRRRLAESESLRRVTAALLEKLGLEEVFEIVCREAQQLTDAAGSAVFLLEDEVWLRPAFNSGMLSPGLDRMRVDGSFAERTVRDSLPLVANKVEEIPGTTVHQAELESVLVVPLCVKAVNIGVLAIANKSGGFTIDDVRISCLFADQAAIAIENAQLWQQKEQLAVLEERQRIAQELHDSVTQSLFSITLYGDVVSRLLVAGDCSRAAEHLGELLDTAREAFREISVPGI